MASLRPETGGRVSLELESAGVEGVVYRAGLYVPDAEWTGEATIDADGTVTVAPFPDAPGWLLDYARAFLRAEWRARQGPDAAPWPERMTRWRAG